VLAIFVISKYAKRELKLNKPPQPIFQVESADESLLDYDSPSRFGSLNNVAAEPVAVPLDYSLKTYCTQRVGFVWIIAILSMCISMFVFTLGPALYSGTYEAITVGLFNDAALMPFALLIALGLAFPFGAYFSHYFGYIVYLIIWSLSFIVDFMRYLRFLLMNSLYLTGI
jgi:hypothetical protein